VRLWFTAKVKVELSEAKFKPRSPRSTLKRAKLLEIQGRIAPYKVQVSGLEFKILSEVCRVNELKLEGLEFHNHEQRPAPKYNFSYLKHIN
jgi:hypothetical protein